MMWIMPGIWQVDTKAEIILGFIDIGDIAVSSHADTVYVIQFYFESQKISPVSQISISIIIKIQLIITIVLVINAFISGDYKWI